MKIKTSDNKHRLPKFIEEASELAGYIKSLNQAEIADCMKVSDKKAEQTKAIFTQWNPDRDLTYAVDCFIGDIYSGLQAATLNNDDRNYADKVLRIISGLYGILRPMDGISPYRLELAYKLPKYANLYEFWSDKLASGIKRKELIVNLTSKEYGRAILPYLNNKIVEPRFLSISTKTNQPEFVVVHAKIARGAFANWLIKNRIDATDDLTRFDQIGYSYEPKLSEVQQPTFVAKDFAGLGLSVRLQ